MATNVRVPIAKYGASPREVRMQRPAISAVNFPLVGATNNALVFDSGPVDVPFVIDHLIYSHDDNGTGTTPAIQWVIVPAATALSGIITTPANGRVVGGTSGTLGSGTKLANRQIDLSAVSDATRRVAAGERLICVMVCTGAWTMPGLAFEVLGRTV